MSVPLVIVRDSFTRANSGTLGANWTSQSSATDTQVLGITSNAAQVQVTGGRASAYWTANTLAANHYSECIVNGSATGTNAHLIGPTVRNTPGGNYYFLQWNMAGTSTAFLTLDKCVNGTLSQVGGTPATNPSVLGSLLRLEVVGSQLSAYIDGNLVFQVTDTDLTTGAPGISGFMAAASPTAFATNWEGGNLIWTRQGTVIPIGSGGGTQEPSVLYDTNPQILSANPDGKIWKMWYMNGWTTAHINYAESANAITWTQYSSNPVITDGSNNSLHGCVFKNGSTYYGYIGNDLAAGTGTTVQFDQWTSSDGVTWTKAHAAVLSIGGAATWDHIEIADPVVWVQGGTWYMLYCGRLSTTYSVGLATSPDGITWTKYASNPVITNGSGTAANGKTITQLGGVYYLWGFTAPSGPLPTDLSMWSSPDLHTWTANSQNPIYERVLLDEGVNLPAAGQVADVCVVQLNGTSYLFYSANNVQSAGNSHINMATAPQTIQQLLNTYFGVSGSSGSMLLLGVGQ